MKVLSRAFRIVCATVVLLHVLTVYAQTSLTNDAVVKMVKAGLAEDLVLTMINTQPAQFSVTPDAMIALKTDGVSDKIIAAMVSKGQPNGPTVAVQPRTPAPPAVINNQARPSESEMLVAIRKDPNRNNPQSPTALALSRTSLGEGARILNIDVTITRFRLIQWGEFNAAEKYWPVEVCVSGTADNKVIAALTRPDERAGLGVSQAQPFQTKTRYRLYKDDFGDLKAEQFLVREWRPQDYICPAVPPASAASGATATVNETRVSSENVSSATACDDATSCMQSGKVLLARGEYQEATALWDKAMEFGGPLEFQMCREGGLSCSAGVLKITAQSLSFVDSKAQKVFEVDTKDFTVVGTESKSVLGGHAFVRLNARVSNKDYNFDFIPQGGDCKHGRYYACAEPAVSQQQAVARYLAQKIKSRR